MFAVTFNCRCETHGGIMVRLWGKPFWFTFVLCALGPLQFVGFINYKVFINKTRKGWFEPIFHLFIRFYTFRVFSYKLCGKVILDRFLSKAAFIWITPTTRALWVQAKFGHNSFLVVWNLVDVDCCCWLKTLLGKSANVESLCALYLG